MSDVLWSRLRYLLSPQWDIYVSLREHLRGQPNVLEVGFGTAAGTMLYADGVTRLTAIEINPDAVEFARSMYPLPHAHWLHQDILTFQPKKPFSAVIAVEVLEHIEDWHAALQVIRNILIESGGEFIMTARNANADLRRAKSQHERELTADELVRTLEGLYPHVQLFDYSLTRLLDRNTTTTPVVALCRT